MPNSTTKETADIELVSVHSEKPTHEPSVVTRLFYAQRYMERQYSEVKSQAGFGWWHDWVFSTLKINSLEPKTSTYPTWTDEKLALRSSHWLVCTGLLTSEIMGAYLVPNSYALVGYVPGNLVLIACFVLTLLAGGLLWWLFLLFDSPEYPIRSLAELGRILGGETWAQIVIFLQVVAMFLTAANVGISGLESLVILQDVRYCWTGLLLAFCTGLGIISSIKSFSNIGKFCLVVSFMNYINLFVQMGYFGEPNWQNAKSLLGLDPAPVVASNFVVQTLVYKLVAVSNISYVFAGSVVFPEILSEMKRPWDFWKSMIAAQTAILATYLVYGNYVYSQQGQFANSPAVFGISKISALKGLSVMTFIVGVLQGVFYGHVSTKVFYKNYFPRIFKGLDSRSKKGIILWYVSTTIVWIIIYVIATGVPNVASISAFTSALTMIPLTYVIPFWFYIWASYIKTNTESITNYDENTMEVNGYERPMLEFMKRGFNEQRLLFTFYSVVSLASLAFAGMGLYGSVEYMKDIFANTSATSFSCTSPI
ncbi:hypothetical protein OGAPHI_003170 [Ogataea philodendri]|uniref:Amino acid transporter transmembrane domain-containing protein n=1 Tax=Ogataea philodendri TaxID=1378263 RepID=A0A9P8T721_9ASCO|nr:uncharacterized protein OGAPHI_003170 [Ogataea philodendri]KAH3667521.1 hypothetical protein OGAPHI_003170 [Ogataea philodendri]